MIRRPIKSYTKPATIQTNACAINYHNKVLAVILPIISTGTFPNSGSLRRKTTHALIKTPAHIFVKWRPHIDINPEMGASCFNKTPQNFLLSFNSGYIDSFDISISYATPESFIPYSVAKFIDCFDSIALNSLLHCSDRGEFEWLTKESNIGSSVVSVISFYAINGSCIYSILFITISNYRMKRNKVISLINYIITS